MALNLYYATSEVAPFCGAYSLSTFSRRITTIYNEDPDMTVRVVHPKYGFISERKYILREVIRLRDLPIEYNGEERIINLKSAFIPESRVQVYFLQYNPYYKAIPELLYKARNGRVFKDNDEKFSFFAEVTLKTLKNLYWAPDYMLCNDWQCSMIPGLFNQKYKEDDFYKNIKTIFLLHSLSDSTRYFSNDVFTHLNLEPPTENKVQDMLKYAMDNSDLVVVVDNEKNELINKVKADKILKNTLDNNNHIIATVDSTLPGKWSQVANSIKTAIQEL
ncbi:MAG: glycogen/starch synthase [Candidatus Marinimicrobia bacterium]|nr:glycogen/starch synthase [Candidatus Neomarinimicrobiota bacterium]